MGGGVQGDFIVYSIRNGSDRTRFFARSDPDFCRIAERMSAYREGSRGFFAAGVPDASEKKEALVRGLLANSVVAWRGFEPPIFALRGRCPKPLDDQAMYVRCLRMAGVEGVEPSHTAPETAVLPLDDTPVRIAFQARIGILPCFSVFVNILAHFLSIFFRSAGCRRVIDRREKPRNRGD